MRTALNWEDLFLPKSLNDFPDHGLPSEFQEWVAEGVKKKKEWRLVIFRMCLKGTRLYGKKT